MIRPAVFVREGEPVRLEDGSRWVGQMTEEGWAWRPVERGSGGARAPGVPPSLRPRRGLNRPLRTYRARRWSRSS